MELPWVLLALAGTGAAADLARLPYVPQVPPMALLGKVTATTFALERPRCVFDGHAEASDAVWLAVAFANASAAFRNPQSRAEVPPYQQLPSARSYMTLETAAAAFSCWAASPPVLRVGADTACREQGRQDPCNGPLPSPGPYRVKFLLMGCGGPKAETRWSEPILLRTGPCGTATPRGSPAPPWLGWWHSISPVPSPQKLREKRSPIPHPPRTPHPASLQPSARAPSPPCPPAGAVPWWSSPPSWPAWAPCWPPPCSEPWVPRRGAPGATRAWGPTPSSADPTGPTTSPRPRPSPCPPAAGAAPQGCAALPPSPLLRVRGSWNSLGWTGP
ncbi:uroplakin-3b [Pyrgilauda ruficollis]|uniref:uroplakin-3b n=1 Tax=Pyrgilauda ruficollis TaxID=221976 RepID=UPI001B87B968|nr:uroplakin-3b [Pyrgilauda ruficollis]